MRLRAIVSAAALLAVLALGPLSAAEAPKGYLLKVGSSEDLDTLSVFTASERAATELFLLVYDPLVSFDEKLGPAPCLAESWKVSADYLEWSFTLRPGLLWSDGQPVTAADVKFTYDALLESGLGLYAPFLAGIVSVEAPDERTVLIRTDKPKANMLQNPTPILPEHVWKAGLGKLEEFSDPRLVGSGPFSFTEWKQGQYFSLAAKPKHQLGAPKVGGIVFTVFANRETLAQALVAGEIDVALNLYPDQLPQLGKAKGVEIHRFSGNGFTELALNCWADPASKGSPALRDRRVRQAVERAIDRKAIVDIAFAGAGEPASTLIPAATPEWHYEPSAAELRSPDPAKAGELLDAAGYARKGADGIRLGPGGAPLALRLLARSDNAREVKAAQMIEAGLRAVGVGVELSTVDDGALQAAIDAADYDLFIWGWGGDVDPTTILALLTTGQIGGSNEPRYSNTAYDAAVERQATLLDPKERQAAVFEAQRIAYEDCPYIVLSYDGDIQALRSDRVAGMAPVAGGPILYANTNVNYLRAAPTGAASRGAAPTVALAAAACALVGAVAYLLTRKRAKKANWDAK